MAYDNKLSHLDELGRAKMVDISSKAVTARVARAEGKLVASPHVMEALRSGNVPKGDVFTVAKVAGIQAAKRTADLIPLCHPLPLSKIDLTFENQEDGVLVRSEVATSSQTGVEMEALTAVSIALLTLYDMTKSMDKAMRLDGIRLVYKEGGKTGVFRA